MLNFRRKIFIFINERCISNHFDRAQFLVHIKITTLHEFEVIISKILVLFYRGT